MLGSWPKNESFANFGVYLIESTMHVCFHFLFFSFHCFAFSLKYESADKIYFNQNDSLVRFFSKASVYSQISAFQKMAAKIAMTPIPRSMISISVQKKQKYKIEKKKCTWTPTTFTALCCIKSRASWFSCIPLGRVVFMLLLNCREQLMLIEEANREKTQNLCKKPNLILIGNRVAKMTYYSLKRSWISWSEIESRSKLKNRSR